LSTNGLGQSPQHRKRDKVKIEGVDCWGENGILFFFFVAKIDGLGGVQRKKKKVISSISNKLEMEKRSTNKGNT
jgi:hypothetical protein